jgi:hypothetical protein
MHVLGLQIFMYPNSMVEQSTKPLPKAKILKLSGVRYMKHLAYRQKTAKKAKTRANPHHQKPIVY